MKKTLSFNEFISEEKKWVGKVHPKKGGMHEVLGIPKKDKIADHFKSGEELAKALVDKVGKKEAAGMINFAANANKPLDLFDAAQKALSSIKESVTDSELNEKKWAQKVDKKKGSMHSILNIPMEDKIEDHFESGEELAKTLVSKVGKKRAAGMINFAANVNSDKNIFDDAQKALSSIKENIEYEENIKENLKTTVYDLIKRNVGIIDVPYTENDVEVDPSSIEMAAADIVEMLKREGCLSDKCLISVKESIINEDKYVELMDAEKQFKKEFEILFNKLKSDDFDKKHCLKIIKNILK